MMLILSALQKTSALQIDRLVLAKRSVTHVADNFRGLDGKANVGFRSTANVGVRTVSQVLSSAVTYRSGFSLIV